MPQVSENSRITEDIEMPGNQTIKNKKKKKNNDKYEPMYTIQILKLIKDLQQQHGLRHSDYQRYRERAWNYAMQLRLEANTEPRKKFHLIARIRKATKYALLLPRLCEKPKFNCRTKLEAEGYVAWIHSTLYFELQLCSSAIEYFKKAQIIYEKLAIALNEDGPFYHHKSEEIILSLRSQAHGELLKNLDVLVAETVKHSTNAMNEIKWRNRSIAVKSENLPAFLLADRDLEKSLINGSILDNINLIERHLMDCKDAIMIAWDKNKNEGGSRNLNPSGDNISSTQLLKLESNVPPIKPTLVDRVDEYYEDLSLTTNEPRIVEIPSPMLPISRKPLFFDLALNMVTFPSFDEKVVREKRTVNPFGIKGFVKGLWGWNNPK
ncbi:hypothetical protein PGB90_002601 [Kerria lacca]